MRLAYLVSRYPSANHTYILREILGLRALGIEIDVAAIDGDERESDALTPAEAEERASTYVVKAAGAGRIAAAHVAMLARRPARYVAALGYSIRLGRTDLRQIAYNLFYFAEGVVVARWMEQRGLDRLHTHYAANVAIVVAKLLPVRVSATIHGSAEFIDPTAHRLREKVAACAFVCAISQFGRSQIMRATPPDEWAKIELTPLGVESAPRADLRVGPPPAGANGAFRLACVGQLQPAKGYHLLLEALAALAAAGRAVTLTIVGDGPDRDALLAHAGRLALGQRVAFVGALNQEGVRKVYACTDAFVLASFAEGVPVVLMEAMAAGVPCVATRITGIPELIRDGVDGLLVTPSSVDELAHAIGRLIDEPGLRATLARSARRRVAEQYNLTTNVQRLADVFRRRHVG